MKQKQVDVVKYDIGEGIPLTEINSGGGGIEQVAGFDPRDIDLEAFMNERLVVIVYEDNREGALRIIRPEVNGVAQPIVRGVKTKVKRKYVEVLARGVNTGYDQVQRDPSDRASLDMIPTTRQSYPFSVIYDPNPLGREWLETIMAERD